MPTKTTTANVHFVRLWTKASRRVYAYILTMVASHTDAEDLLQDVGMAAWERFSEFDPERDFVAWVCGIAHFKALMHLRSSARLKRFTFLSETLLEDLRVETALMSEMLDRQHRALEECLSQLPSADRKLIRWRYTPRLTTREIASRTGRTISAVYKSLKRIHDQLYQCATRKLSAEVRT